MKTDFYTRAVLTVIAIALVVIAFQLIFQSTPTRGDFLSLRNIENQEARVAKLKELKMRIPLVWVEGGEINAEVSGSVTID
jgi:hypothetical protein